MESSREAPWEASAGQNREEGSLRTTAEPTGAAGEAGGGTMATPGVRGPHQLTGKGSSSKDLLFLGDEIAFGV